MNKLYQEQSVINIANAIRNCEGTLLPKEYQQVEYIENTGTQYIDTGIKGNQDTKIILDIRPTAIYTSGAFHLCGDISDSSAAISCNFTSGTGSITRFGNKQTTAIAANVTVKRQPVIISNKGYYIDNILKWTPNSDDFITINNIYLFKTNGSDATGFSGKIYNCKIYDNNILIRNFIPCYRKSDGVIGLYDTVNNTFYTNAGTGTFLKGNDVEPTFKISEMDEAIYNIYDKLTDLIPQNTITGANELTLANAVGLKLKNYKRDGNNVQNTTQGYNQVGIADISERTVYGMTYSAKDGILSINGTSTNYVYIPLQFSLTTNTLKTFKLFIDNGTRNNSIGIRFKSNNVQTDFINIGTSSDMQSKNIDINNIDGVDVFFAPNLTASSLKLKIMLADSTEEVASYEPYTGGQPSPNPDYPQEIKSVGDLVESGEYQGKYKIPVVSSGVNLAYTEWAEDFVSRINDNTKARIETFDGKNCLRYSANAGSGEYDTKYMFKTNWKENTRYIFKFKIYSLDGYRNLSIRYTDETSTSITGPIPSKQWYEITMISDYNKTIKDLRTLWSSGNNYIDLDTFMVYEGTDTTKPYEPYHAPITTNIYLDEPLRKLPNGVKDELSIDKQENVKLLKKIERNTINIIDRYDNLPLNVAYRFRKPTNSKDNGAYTTNAFTEVATNETTGFPRFKGGGWTSYYALEYHKNQGSLDNIPTLEQVKLLVDGKYFYYELATPQTIDLGRLPKIPTFKGTTIITIGTEIAPYSTQVVYYYDWNSLTNSLLELGGE